MVHSTPRTPSARHGIPSGWSTRVACLALLLLGLGAASPVASASHYRLPVDGMISPDEARLFGAHGVHTTADLLERTAALAAREALARETRIPLPRLTTLACQVDLLRVAGLGPSMVKLLQSGGVRHTRDLKGAAPAELLGRLRAANAIHNIAPVLPAEGVIEDWIAQANALEWILEGTQ